MLAFRFDAGDLDAADGDGLGALPGFGRIDGRVSVRRDLDLVVEPNRLRRKAIAELVDQEVRAFRLRDVRRQEILAGCRKQVVADESSTTVGGDPAKRVQAVVRDGAVACRHFVRGTHDWQCGQKTGVGGDVSGETQRSGGAGAHRVQ